MTWSMGQRVRIGGGKVVWIVDGFFLRGDVWFVSLTKEGSNGYVNTSTTGDRLRAVDS